MHGEFMKVDLNTARETLDGLPRFQRSKLVSGHLLLLIYLPGLAALSLWGAGYSIELFSVGSYWPVLFTINASALLLVAATAQSILRVVRWRAKAMGHKRKSLMFWRKVNPEPALTETLNDSGRLLYRFANIGRRLLHGLGTEALWLIILTGLALLLLRDSWHLDLPVPTMAGQLGWIAVGVLVACAFGLVVIERHLAAETQATYPEAEALAAILRLVITVQVLSAVCLMMIDGQRLWPARMAVLIAVLPGLAAIELLLRAVFSMFSPKRPQQEPTLIARSMVAASLHWPPRPLAALQGELKQRLGIDLQQIWAFDFMRRAFLPVLALVALIGWLLTGVVQVPMDERGVYELFGKPVQIYKPGLHVGLPWPLGKVQKVDNGIVHELATALTTSEPEPLAPAEGQAPASAHRLWDANHLSENSQVIAGSDGDQQSFQIVNMDVRFIYRIGSSDAAAMAATYRSADVAQLLRSIANRVLVHDFAGRSLDQLLGAEREMLGQDIGRAVQADLDRLGSGVDLLATSVEAIHPPAGAANAYHAVQAAQITAQALIARNRGEAARQAYLAHTNSTILTDKASADAHEATSQARIVELRFSAERTAWQRAGQAFLLEQYLGRLAQGLKGSSSLIIDHRLKNDQQPMLDLRTYSNSASLGFP